VREQDWTHVLVKATEAAAKPVARSLLILKRANFKWG
jgi:hypothetical protein